MATVKRFKQFNMHLRTRFLHTGHLDNLGSARLKAGSGDCAAQPFGFTFSPFGSRGPFAVLIAIYICAGITGHEPWKADEAYIFGVVHSMLEDGSWLVPLVAGEPFMEKPPLFAWVAAGLVQLCHGWLREPDAARLASVLFMATAAWSLASAAHRWWGRGMGRYAPVLLCSCLGLLVQSHMMMPDVALLAGISVALLGFSRILDESIAGGILLGLGTGIAFLAKGLIGPGVTGLSAAALPIFFAQWRNRRYCAGLLIAAGAALPMLVIWPTLLYIRSPELFTTWLWNNNVGRFLGSSIEISGTEKTPWFWSLTLPWFAFPVLPLALYTLALKRRVFFMHAGVQCTTVMASAALLALTLSAAARGVYALPLLAPLAVLSVPAVLALGKRVERAWFFAGMAIFGTISVAIWSAWLIMMQTHLPPDWPWLTRMLPASFAPSFNAGSFLVASVLTFAAIVAMRKLVHQPGRAVTGWAISMTLAWSLLATLHMPWLDYAKSYSTVFHSIPWPAGRHCIESRGLGESERAMLDYYADRLTLRKEVVANARCDLLFVQGFAGTGPVDVDQTKWTMIWSGARPGDTWQKFWLYEIRS